MVTPYASDECAGLTPGTPHRNTEHPDFPTEDFPIPESTFCGQDKNQSPTVLNVVTNHSIEKMGRRLTSEKVRNHTADVVALVKIQGGIQALVSLLESSLWLRGKYRVGPKQLKNCATLTTLKKLSLCQCQKMTHGNAAQAVLKPWRSLTFQKQ